MSPRVPAPVKPRSARLRAHSEQALDPMMPWSPIVEGGKGWQHNHKGHNRPHGASYSGG
jgi:hypothetical protein